MRITPRASPGESGPFSKNDSAVNAELGVRTPAQLFAGSSFKRGNDFLKTQRHS